MWKGISKKETDTLREHYSNARRVQSKGCIGKCDNGLSWFTREDMYGNIERFSQPCTFCQSKEK